MIKKGLLLILMLFFSVAYADSAPEPLAADKAFVVSATVDDESRLVLHWQIAPNYLLYKDKISLTTLADNHSQLGHVQLPAGVQKQDEIHGVFQAYFNELTLTVPLKTHDGRLSVAINYQGCSADGFCYAPITQYVQVDLSQMAANQPIPLSEDLGVRLQNGNLLQQDFATQLLQDKHYWVIALGFLLFGVLLSFTPCVLPMIPILSSIIVGYGKTISTRRAFTLSVSYVMGMSLSYALAGMLVALAGNHIQTALQQPWVIILFSLMFALLALSLFDWYELKLPNRLHKKIFSWSHHHEGGTLVGVFFMGALSTLVVSPCVSAPLVGVLAYIGNSGNVILGGLALMALGIGMGIPLILIGTSAGKFLPKSGAWMVRVKHFFGLLMFGVAIWMLARVLPGAIILFLWAVLAFASALFVRHLRFSRKVWRHMHHGVAAAVLVYAFVLLGGAFYGQTDPMYLVNQLTSANPIENSNLFIAVKDMQELDTQLAAAKQDNKPVLLDFYADWCASCVYMDKHVFNHDEITTALKNYVVLRIDVTKNDIFDRTVLARFKVVAPPTMLFFKGDGEENHAQTIVGEVNAYEFLANLSGPSADQTIKLCKNNSFSC